MTFGRRLRTYLVGVGLGLLMVYIFFGDRDLTTWTPEGRVLIAIDSSTHIISDLAKCQMQCLVLSDSSIYKIQEVADVIFSESSTQKKPCPIYKIKSTWKEEKYSLTWEVCEFDEVVTLNSILKEGTECGC
ncbi:MAG: hypothetical protein DWP98_02115 [Bacteroidetes bacterium]|nr:MAG: hypothetical protein DWP98_02115 [Bacteroidota bacterium]MBL1145540.1 hypothetical protein [Bacteroidota bacterium]NOG58337.1 hypothetical protein [Bacteroidota bacterium]